MDLPKIAECPVCLELFTEPKVLGCGHCFCKKCISPASRGLGFNLQPKVTCPECRQESSVPAGGFPTNYRLLDIVSNLESAGFRNTKDCGGCGRKTPKVELFSCTTCQAELGDAHQVVICSLCYVKAHKTHAIVDFNKATPQDVQQAREKIAGERAMTQMCGARVRSQLEGLTQMVMQALDERPAKHDELSAQLSGENISKDDIEAKLAQSQTIMGESKYIMHQMRDILDDCGRSLMAHVQQQGASSQAAAAPPAADQPTTSAAARAAPRSGVLDEWDVGLELYGGGSLLGRFSTTPPVPRLLSSDVNDAFFFERPALAPAAPDSAEQHASPVAGTPLQRYISRSLALWTGNAAAVAAPRPQRDNSPSAVVRPIQTSGALSRRNATETDTPERNASPPPARATARSPPPRRLPTPARPRVDVERRPTRGTQDLDEDLRNMARTMSRINNTWRNYERSASLFPAADGFASSSGTAPSSRTASSSGTAPQEPTRGRSPPRDPRRQARRTYRIDSSDEEDNDNDVEFLHTTSLAAKRARR